MAASINSKNTWLSKVGVQKKTLSSHKNTKIIWHQGKLKKFESLPFENWKGFIKRKFKLML
jgi:hypothetical protein